MPKKTIRIAWDASYQLRTCEQASKLIILLHGFQQSGDTIFRLLEGCMNPDAIVLAPDAPFPMPRKVEKSYKMDYTWYFFDPETDTYLYDMSIAVNYLTTLLEELNLGSLPITVVGYSQGGYLAPFVGEQLSRVTQVVGINCRFRSETLTRQLPFRLDAIHGEKDILVDPERAANCHREIMSQGNLGTFYSLPNCGHGISGEVRSLLRELI